MSSDLHGGQRSAAGVAFEGLTEKWGLAGGKCCAQMVAGGAVPTVLRASTAAAVGLGVIGAVTSRWA
jgi:hypothetical protein